MTRPIAARVLLSSNPRPDPWFGIRYTMNLYRGCQHQCVYCDSRSECYGIDDFADVQVKTNALELLERELRRKRTRGTVGTGSMNDPYMPLEGEIGLTGRALEILARHEFPVHVITKSTLVLRDLEVLRRISRVYAAVSLTVTTPDDELSRRLEPGAPVSSARLRTVAELSAQGILTGVLIMPVLPWIEDREEDVLRLVDQAHAAGARYVMASFGVTLRDRQRAHYYRCLDKLFPGLRQEYQRRYGDQYGCPSPAADRLEMLFRERCAAHGISIRMPFYQGEQLPLL